MKVYIYVLVVMLAGVQGCSQVVTQPQPLHDGRWGEYNEGMSEQCAHASILQGKLHNLSNEAVAALFNQCVFDQGLTI